MSVSYISESWRLTLVSMARRNKTRTTFTKIQYFHQPFCSSHVFLEQIYKNSIHPSPPAHAAMRVLTPTESIEARPPPGQTFKASKLSSRSPSFATHFISRMWHCGICRFLQRHWFMKWCDVQFVPPKDVFFSTKGVSMSSSNPLPFKTWETELECYFPLSCFLYRMKERTTPFNWFVGGPSQRQIPT